VTLPDGDGPLVLTRRRLDAAVHALADPVLVWDGGVCRWSDGLYSRLRGAITARTAGRRPVMAGSRAPCRTDVLVWLIEVDTAVAARTPDDKGSTVERLHALTARGWRPQDCEVLDDYSTQVEKWFCRRPSCLVTARWRWRCGCRARRVVSGSRPGRTLARVCGPGR
jgi:hypothetical protein